MFLASACGSSDDGGSTSTSAAPGTTAAGGQTLSGDLTISWVTELQAGMKPIVAAFQKQYPDVNVKAEYINYSQYATQLLTRLQSGNSSDVLYVSPGTGQPISVGPLASAGKLAELSGPWTEGLPDATLKDIQYQGKIYAAPVGLQLEGMVYNGDLLSSMGLEPPKTFGDLVALCGKIAAKGKTPIAIGGADPTTTGSYRSGSTSSLVYAVEPDFIKQRTSGDVTFATSPAWRSLVQGFADLKDAGCFSKGAQGTTAVQALTQLAQGDAVFSFSGTNVIPALDGIVPGSAAKMKFMAVPALKAEDTRVTVSTASTIGQAAKAKNPELAKAFIDFAMKNSQLYADAGGSLTTTQVTSAKVPEALAAAQPLLADKKYLSTYSSDMPNGNVHLTLAEQMQGLLTGQTTVDGVLKATDKAWDTGG
jgi:raffinose/stachyose/melibiose transport system substrate-binding protein